MPLLHIFILHSPSFNWTTEHNKMNLNKSIEGRMIYFNTGEVISVKINFKYIFSYSEWVVLFRNS